MVKFIEVDPNEIDNVVATTRGRVSYPILKGFLETGMFVAEIDTTGMQQTTQGLMMSLRSYINNHKMPVKIFSRKGTLYLMRLDIDREGNPIDDWNKGKEPDITKAVAITPGEVKTRFDQEKDKTTK